MPTVSAIPVQLQATVRSVPPVGLIDINTGEWAAIWKGGDSAFNVGIFNTAGFSVDLSNLISLTLEIFPYVDVKNYLGYPQSACLSNIIDGDLYVPGINWPFYGTVYPAIVSVTVLANAITSPITRQRWDAGLAQNATFTATASETAQFDLQGQPQKRFTACLSGNVTGGGKIIYGSGPIFVYESGITLA